MKIAIVSDTHDNMANFQKAIDFLNTEKIEVMLHCGDICNQQTIDEATKNFKGEIYWVRGNGDHDLDLIPGKMEIELGGKKMAWVHYPEIAKKLAESGTYDAVFYGHTHRPWEETIGKCRLVNPGELAGQRYKPCFALYDTVADKLELKILETL
ncbi:metallophosphoesterase [Candidatus Parcubacteria bacterium]|nr:metallophosphoesterase [Candidatus Parcubacteria bacterium]